MYVVVIKLIEVMARAGFTVGATFTLPLAAAGQFGIIVTLAGLFSFAFGWERHVDIQRRFVGTEPETFDAAVTRAVPLWGFNYSILLPTFLVAVWIWTGVDAWLLLLCAVVAVSEHIANVVYQLSLVERRYHRFLIWVAAKNVAVALLVGAMILFAPSRMTLEYVLLGWAGASAVSTTVIVLMWLGVRRRGAARRPFDWQFHVFEQHRLSFTHFCLGLLGVTMLQFDRLVVGALLPLAEVGVYFRHILLVSFAYQFFNIASHNRVLPRVFAYAKTHTISESQAVVRTELFRVAGVVLLGFAILWAADHATGGVWTARFSVDLGFAAILVAGAMVRIAADFQGLILNSRMRENLLIRQQIVAFSVGAVLLVALTWAFGMVGTAAASLATSTLYFLLNRRAVSRLPQEPILPTDGKA